MLSGAIAAPPAGFYAVVLLVVTPQTVFGMLVSAQALIVTLFGGVGTFWGPVIGAAILVPLAEILHAELGHVLPGIQGVVYGSRSSSSSCWRPKAFTGGCATGLRARGIRGAARRLPAPCRRTSRRAIAGAARAPARGRVLDARRRVDVVRRAEGGRRRRASPSRRARSTASSARTAPARPRCSTCINGFLPADARQRRCSMGASIGRPASRTQSAVAASAARSRSCARSRA